MPYLTIYRVVQCGATEYKGTTLGTTNQAFWYILLHLNEIRKWLKCLFYNGFEAKRRKRGMIIDNSSYPKVAVQCSADSLVLKIPPIANTQTVIRHFKTEKMTRIILSTAFILSLSMSFGQVSHKLVHNVGSTTDSTIQVIFEHVDTTMKRYLVFENKNTIDTLFLSITDNKFHSNTCQIEQIQIDGKGLKEIHIKWTYTEPFGLGDYIGGQTSWGEQTIFVNHEIWSLDMKKRLFSAVSLYSVEKYTTYHGRDEQTINTHSFWSYDFSINENGRITISNIKKTKDQIPDNTEGIYTFADGKYHKE